MDDLVKRLREFAIHTPLSKPMLLKAADRIEALEASIAKVREEALREAADVAADEANWVPHKPDDFRKAILALIEKTNPGS